MIEYVKSMLLTVYALGQKDDFSDVAERNYLHGRFHAYVAMAFQLGFDPWTFIEGETKDAE